MHLAKRFHTSGTSTDLFGWSIEKDLHQELINNINVNSIIL